VERWSCGQRGVGGVRPAHVAFFVARWRWRCAPIGGWCQQTEVAASRPVNGPPARVRASLAQVAYPPNNTEVLRVTLVRASDPFLLGRRIMKRRRLAAHASLVGLLCPALVATLGLPPAHAGGQYAGDNGSQGMQRAGAFVAKADDPSAIYYNPAGLFKAKRKEFFLGLNLVSLSQSFQRDGYYLAQDVEDGEAQPAYVGDPYPKVSNGGGAQPVPFMAAAFPDDTVVFGVGFFAPHGYGKKDFPVTVQSASSDSAPAPQRYDAVAQEGLVILPSAAIALELNDKIAIGARASWAYFQVKSHQIAQGLPSRAEDPARDTQVTVDVTDPFVFTYGLGAHVRMSEAVELGFAYNAPMVVEAKGTTDTVLGDDLANLMPGEETVVVPVPDDQAKCAPGGAIGAIQTCLNMKMPATATAGMRLIKRDRKGREQADIEFDLRWENWSAADDYTVIIDGMNSAVATPVEETHMKHGYQDVYSFRLGASSRIERNKRAYELRCGVAYETAATPRSWTRLDTDTAERYTVATGLGIEFGSSRIDVGLAYLDSPPVYVHNVPLDDTNDVAKRVQPDVTNAMSDAESQPYHPYNAGLYETSYLIGTLGYTTWW